MRPVHLVPNHAMAPWATATPSSPQTPGPSIKTTSETDNLKAHVWFMALSNTLPPRHAQSERSQRLHISPHVTSPWAPVPSSESVKGSKVRKCGSCTLRMYSQNGVRWGVGASGKDDDETVNDDGRRGRWVNACLSVSRMGLWSEAWFPIVLWQTNTHAAQATCKVVPSGSSLDSEARAYATSSSSILALTTSWGFLPIGRYRPPSEHRVSRRS